MPTPTRDGYTLEGWFTQPDGGTEVTVDTVFTENTTIYAHWKIKAGLPTPSIPAQPTPTYYPSVPVPPEVFYGIVDGIFPSGEQGDSNGSNPTVSPSQTPAPSASQSGIIPRTADEAPIETVIAVFVAALAGLVVLLLLRKKHK